MTGHSNTPEGSFVQHTCSHGAGKILLRCHAIRLPKPAGSLLASSDTDDDRACHFSRLHPEGISLPYSNK